MKKDYFEGLRKAVKALQEHNEDGRYEYFICTRDAQSNDVFSAADADKQVLTALLAAAMRTNKDVEDCILWLAEHYKHLNTMVKNELTKGN